MAPFEDPGVRPDVYRQGFVFCLPKKPKKLCFLLKGVSFQAEKSYPFSQILRYLCVKTTVGHQGLIQGAFCQVWLSIVEVGTTRKTLASPTHIVF